MRAPVFNSRQAELLELSVPALRGNIDLCDRALRSNGGCCCDRPPPCPTGNKAASTSLSAIQRIGFRAGGQKAIGIVRIGHAADPEIAVENIDFLVKGKRPCSGVTNPRAGEARR